MPKHFKHCKNCKHCYPIPCGGIDFEALIDVCSLKMDCFNAKIPLDPKVEIPETKCEKFVDKMA